MNALEEIIGSLNTIDKQLFVRYLKSKSTRDTHLNVQLLELLETDDISAVKKFKERYSADAFHAHRKRLYDSVVDFLAMRTFENDISQEHEILKLLVVSRRFLEQQLNKAAFKCLAKAEVIAEAMEHYSLLNEIYHTQVQYAHLGSVASFDALIQKYNDNRQKLEKEEKLNVAYALLRKELGEIYHKGKITNLRQLIEDTISSLGISLEDVITFKSLYQMLYIANEYASINSDFRAVDAFAVNSYAFLSGRQDLAEKHLFYHIQILYFMANLHFRNRRYDEANADLTKMQEQMQKQGGRYQPRFVFRHALLAALTANYSGNPQGAITIVEKTLKTAKKATAPDVNDLRLSLIVVHLQLDDGKQAYVQLRELSRTDSWYEKTMGMDWAIKKNLVELLAHITMEHTELALSRIKSFRRRYKKYLEAVSETRVLMYLQLLERYATDLDVISDPAFRENVERLIANADTGGADIFVISFLGWLLARIQKKLPYEVILAMAGS